MLRDIAQYAKAPANAAASGPASNLSPRSAARHLWAQLQAKACLPQSAKIRNEVDTICAEEIDTFRRRCGGLMTEEQERAVKIVTARISERVGEWITRAWSDSAASRQQPSGRRGS